VTKLNMVKALVSSTHSRSSWMLEETGGG